MSYSVNTQRSSDGSVATLRSCLVKTQTELDKARDEIKRLQLENASLKAKNNAKQLNKRVTVTGPFDYTATLRLMANKFTLFDYPWVKYAVFQFPCPPQAITIEDRYLSDENMVAHLRFRLSEAATTELKPYLESAKISEFGNNFVFYCQTQRSNTILKACKSATSILAAAFPEQSVDLWSNIERRATSEFCRGLYMTKDDKSGSEVFKDILAPIIFANCEVKASGIFQNELLYMIGTVCLFGSGPLEGKKASKKSNGVIWGIKHVSAGFIAWTCIVALYLVSNDRAFEEVGPSSRIPYAEAYNTYKQRLELHAESPRFRNIIKTWNTRIFGTNTDGIGGEIGGSDTVNARLAAIDAELFDDPGSDYPSDSETENPTIEGSESNPIDIGILSSASHTAHTNPLVLTSRSSAATTLPFGSSPNDPNAPLSFRSVHNNPAPTLSSFIPQGSFAIPTSNPTSVISLYHNGNDSDLDSDAEPILPELNSHNVSAPSSSVAGRMDNPAAPILPIEPFSNLNLGEVGIDVGMTSTTQAPKRGGTRGRGRGRGGHTTLVSPPPVETSQAATTNTMTNARSVVPARRSIRNRG